MAPNDPAKAGGAVHPVTDSTREPDRPQQKVDPKAVAARLKKELPKLNESLAQIEEAKGVRREALDLEISI